jgi:Ca2+-binding RTX toxin-like protein
MSNKARRTEGAAMSREALDRAITLKALAQAQENPAVGSNVFDTDASNTITQVQRESPFGPSISLNDMIWDNGGDDFVSSGAGDDWLIAGRGADAYDGGRGFDVLAYVRADTRVIVNMNIESGTNFFTDTNSSSFAHRDTMKNVEGVVGSRFDDTIRGFSDNRSSYINGFDGNDTIFSGRGADVLKGGKGHDTIHILKGERDAVFGGEGNDAFVIAGEADIVGGAGADSFIFRRPSFLETGPRDLGDLVIHDFDVGGIDDVLKFEGSSMSALDIAVDGADIVITIDGVEGSVRLLNTDLLDIAGAIRF